MQCACSQNHARASPSFSEILSGVKLSGAVFFAAEFSAPWGFTMPASGVMAARLFINCSSKAMCCRSARRATGRA